MKAVSAVVALAALVTHVEAAEITVFSAGGAKAAPSQYSGRYQDVCLICCLVVCLICYCGVGWDGAW